MPFLQRANRLLGIIITNEGIKPDPHKVETIKRMPLPRKIKELRRFLGATGYYRRFISRYSEKASILHRMLESVKKFKWTEEGKFAFESLKQKLVEAPILIFPDFKHEFRIETDASNFAWEPC